MNEPRTYTLTLVDARDVDGTPYQACASAFDNLNTALRVSQEATEAALILARNAHLQRQHDAGEAMDAAGWPDTLLARRLVAVKGDLERIQQEVGTLKRAASFDPRVALDVRQ